MNTNQLIDVLSANLEPVNHDRLRKTLILGMVTGGAAALAVMLATVGPRPDLLSTIHLEWSGIKLLFSLSVVGMGSPLLIRLMQPGLEKETHWTLVWLPFMVAMVAALVAFLFCGHQEWREMLLGASTVSPARCLLLIVFFSAIPLAALFWAIREGAPTRLKLCGTIAGVVAGGLGATAYVLTCRSDTMPFIAIWYGTAMAFCGFIGAQIGPRLLRW